MVAPGTQCRAQAGGGCFLEHKHRELLDRRQLRRLEQSTSGRAGDGASLAKQGLL